MPEYSPLDGTEKTMAEKTYLPDDGRSDPLERLESICRIIGRLLRIGLVIQVVALVAFVIVSLQAGVLSALTLTAQGSSGGELGNLPASVGNLVSLCLTIPVLWLGQRMCDRIVRDHRPFERECAADLYKCGILMLLAGFVPCAISLPLAIIVPGGGEPYALQLALAMSGAIVVAVSRIFDYGCILQAQDDGLV